MALSLAGCLGFGIQAVNHPYLVVHSSTAPGLAEGTAPSHGSEGSCNICHDPLEDGIAAECGHAFCRACLTEYLETATGTAKCHACEHPLTVDLANAPKVCLGHWIRCQQYYILCMNVATLPFKSSGMPAFCRQRAQGWLGARKTAF